MSADTHQVLALTSLHPDHLTLSGSVLDQLAALPAADFPPSAHAVLSTEGPSRFSLHLHIRSSSLIPRFNHSLIRPVDRLPRFWRGQPLRGPRRRRREYPQARRCAQDLRRDGGQAQGPRPQGADDDDITRVPIPNTESLHCTNRVHITTSMNVYTRIHTCCTRHEYSFRSLSYS